MHNIEIQGATEGNLKNVTLEIPRNKLVCITGVSGSGKSTLVMDTLYQECQRQYLEAMGYQGIKKPDVEAIRNVSPAIQIGQHHANKNPRSSVGTSTDIYTELRMVYEKIGERECPNCHTHINNADCKEIVEKNQGEFKVYMICHACNEKMEKLTRSHFSYNTQDGACKACSGLGEQLKINWQTIVDETKSFEDGALLFSKGYNDYVIGIVYKAFEHYELSSVKDIAVADWPEMHRAILFDGVEKACADLEITAPKNVSDGRFEGLGPMLWRRLSEKKGADEKLSEHFLSTTCEACHGERLNADSRAVVVQDTRLPELVTKSLEQLYMWIQTLEQTLNDAQRAAVASYLLDLQTKIARLLKVGLGYLTLNRQTITLSGGELQKIKLSATLDSTLTGVLYLLDEPTAGLHPKDTTGMIALLQNLRDLGNTIIVIEHDTEMMQAADFLVDIGPAAGSFGGEVIGTGKLQELLTQEKSVTGQFLRKEQDLKEQVRVPKGTFTIEDANTHNLQNITVNFPISCLTAVVGASGSGKSTLIFDVLPKEQLPFDQVIEVRQASITKMKRSNIATFTDAFTVIRSLYSKLEAAKEQGLTAKHFSFNTAGGRCENCEGLGVVPSNMLFFENVELTCPVCNGKRFKDEVLAITWEGLSISEMLDQSVTQASILFAKDKKLSKIFNLLEEVGLGYVTLGQSLTTLSGGEGQRLKLAKELLGSKTGNNLFLIDEPTTGLHPLDIEHFIKLLDRMVDAGNTVIVVEHNEQLIRSADFVIELGPEGGDKGGTVIATGTPKEIKNNAQSIMGEFL